MPTPSPPPAQPRARRIGVDVPVTRQVPAKPIINSYTDQDDQAGMVTIKFESELASFQENLNQVSSVSLLMTSSTALANEGRLVVIRETTEKPGCSQVKFA